jgi:hypothetical protein
MGDGDDENERAIDTSSERSGINATRWVISGSRLLPARRAANLESGSPPDIFSCGRYLGRGMPF